MVYLRLTNLRTHAKIEDNRVLFIHRDGKRYKKGQIPPRFIDSD